MINLKVITASTRPGRKGILVSHWVLKQIQKNPELKIEHLDLAEINLPFMDEPHHPRLQKYTKQHTFEWSKMISGADAFVIVMPEYNYGFTAPLKNAIDFLSKEWAYKALGIVSYGGLSAGTRAAQMIKQVLTTLKLFVVTEAVNIPFFETHVKADIFEGTEMLNRGLDHMIAEIIKVDKGLRIIRSAQ